MTKFSAQKRISTLWFIAIGALGVLFMILTATGRFDDKNLKAWEWFTQNAIPVTTLILGALIYNVNRANKDEAFVNQEIDVFYFRLAYYITWFFIISLFLTLLLAPIAFKSSGKSIIEFFDTSKLFLTGFQGILTYALGLFFIKEN